MYHRRPDFERARANTSIAQPEEMTYKRKTVECLEHLDRFAPPAREEKLDRLQASRRRPLIQASAL